MAARWSNPSGGLGVERFRVWPLGSDSYSHTDLTNNFDEVDAIIGIPSSGNWPPSTGVDGGIYKEVQLIKNDGLKEIGEIFYFFRPSLSVPIPDGCVVCDGATLAPADHDFPGVAGSVTLPDIVNAFILGADIGKSIGAAGVVVGGAGIDTSNGAPGPQGTGGINQVTQSISQMPSHDHGGETGVTGSDNEGAQVGSIPVTQGFSRTFEGGNEIFNHKHTITAQGSGQPMDNRPRYVGLIPLCKVKRITTL